ncbi:hypothetical protein [Streptomyces syringium]
MSESAARRSPDGRERVRRERTALTVRLVERGPAGRGWRSA